MINVSESLNQVLYKDSTVRINSGCLLEYNMNSLLDNILVTATGNSIVNGQTVNLDQGYQTSPDGRINVFKKLFPIDSIVKPNRPENSGVKYYILLDSDIDENQPVSFTTFPYPISTKPRMYYPATTNYYKYWVTPENSTFDITVRYQISQATISESYSTGSDAINYPNRVVYTTTTPHGFIAGQTVTVSGGTALNITGEIAAILSPTQFYISSNIAEATSTGGTATLSAATKPALANKAVIRFEKYHLLPSSCKVLITYSDNTTSGELTFSSTSYSDGSLILYWNGTTWIAKSNTYPDGPYLATAPISWPSPKEIRSIRVWTTVYSGVERIYGITEISTRWVKDITSDVISFDIQKESTATEDALLPVGTITANSMQMSISRYDDTRPNPKVKIIDYNRDAAWFANSAPSDSIYLYKDIQALPYFMVYHAGGGVTDGSLKYDRIKQGTFFIDTYEISTYGDAQINALDGAKYLMQTVPIDLYLENAPVTSVLMALLDTIGFTNYNFNLSNDDTSVPTMRKWWTDNQKTTWDHIQEICRDIQMNAFFDENNVLQFYSRDNIYNKSSVDWTFYNDATVVGQDTRLPSIINFSKKELASANQVKIIWRTPISSLYEGDAEALWASEPTYLVAGGLTNTIEASQKAEDIDFQLNFSMTNNEDYAVFSSFNFNGYFLVNSEIFEYDAIEYSYVLEGTNPTVPPTEWIESKSQWASVRAGTKVGPEYFKPTGKFRIKKRGVFGTKPEKHLSTVASSNNTWTQIKEERWNV